MTVTLLTTGGLFTRLGVFASGINSANKFLASGDIDAGGLDSVGVLLDTKARAQFASALQYVLETPQSLYATREAVRSALDTYKQSLRTFAEQTLIEQVHADVTLVDKSVTGAIKELIVQMKGSGSLYNADNDVDASVASAVVSANSGNTGTGKLVVSVVRPDGRNHELCLAETLEAICQTDGQVSGTAGSETFLLRGEPAITDSLAHNWPGGSAASVNLTSIDATLDNSGNLLTNSCFDIFNVNSGNANLPDNWVLGSAGTLGTDIFAEASVIYGTTGKALKFTGTGSNPLSEISQTFDDAGGTLATLVPNGVYAVNFFAKDSGAGLTAGVVAVSLVDGSGTVINDDAGTANTVSFAYSDTTGTYAAFNGYFRLPKVLPSIIKLRIKVTTALTSGESVYIDHLALAAATDIYGQGNGPYACLFSGSTNWIVDDKITVAVSNTRTGGMQEWFNRLFDMRALGLQLPSDTGGAETIADTLISSLETVTDYPQVVATIDPANLNGATTLSDAVDMRNHQFVDFILLAGANDAAIDFKLVESATSGGSYTDISGKVITQETGGDDDNKQWEIRCRQSDLSSGMNFVKASVTVASGTTNMGALVAVGLRPFDGYSASNDLSTVTQIIGS